MALIGSVRVSGVEMAADVYPYAAARTGLDQRIPEWAHEGVLELPEAVRKMTSLLASRVGLEDRGTVARGMKADLVAFDPDSIVDRATFTEPHRLSRGVEWLVVNGEVVVEDGEHTGATPGRALRSGGGS